jgi:hypothetical protein
MTFRVQLLKGLIRPLIYKYQLQEAEEFKYYKLKLAWLFLLSVALFAVSGYLGIGSESITKEWTDLTNSEFEARKQLFLLGKIVLGFMFPVIFLFLAALFFWSIVEIPYKKLVVIQMSVFCMALFEKALNLLIYTGLNVDQASNPLAFGVIAQYITTNKLVCYFFGEITIFQLLMIGIISYYLTALSGKSKKVIIPIVSLFFAFCWFISALLAYIRIGVFF